MLQSIPCLNPEVQWEELESGALMAVYKRHESAMKRLWRRFLSAPEVAQVALDDAGSMVVRAIDGRKTVDDLIGCVARELRLSRRESEVSLLKYMDMLGRRRLIGFMAPGRKGEER